MKNDDLPAPGTRWGDIPPEVRERLPAGTRLDAIPGREWSLPITRMVHGGWFDDLGTRAPCDVHPARPILSYPTDAGTPKPADTPKEPAMNDDKIPPRPWSPVNGHVRDYADRHVVGVTSIRWTIEERDAIIGHIVTAVNAYDTHEARIAELERERDAYKRAKAENDERFMVERDEARAEVARLRAVIVADLPTYPRASMDEPPASITPPPGWEWAGEWAPSGAMTADGFPIWRRAVRRVAK